MQLVEMLQNQLVDGLVIANILCTGRIKEPVAVPQFVGQLFGGINQIILI
jgi:hypothetical protein